MTQDEEDHIFAAIHLKLEMGIALSTDEIVTQFCSVYSDNGEPQPLQNYLYVQIQDINRKKRGRTFLTHDDGSVTCFSSPQS
jgi:hypothetical protein